MGHRNLPTKTLINKYANVMNLFGAVAIILGISIRKSGTPVPLVYAIPLGYALLPGFLAGALIGGDSLLLWRMLRKSDFKGSAQAIGGRPQSWIVSSEIFHFARGSDELEDPRLGAGP